MQKDECQYTFLFTHSYRSKTYVRRIEISKKRLHHSAVAATVLLAAVLTGIFGTTKFDAAEMAKAETKSPAQNLSRQSNLSQSKSIPENKTFDYARPAQATTTGTGGPAAASRLTNVEAEAEENAMEIELVNIEKTSNPQFLPTIWAHLGKINNEFGFRRNPFGGRSYEFHPGLDISGDRGDAIIAPANGTVVRAGWTGGYGNLIEVDHGNGLLTRYGHLSKIEVQIGDVIERGQEIGLIGSTGRSTGPHLHFEIRLGDKAINPRRFLPPELPN